MKKIYTQINDKKTMNNYIKPQKRKPHNNNIKRHSNTNKLKT